MEGCPACGTGTRRPVRFGAAIVQCCSSCHALTVHPIVDPRVPSFEEHVRALQEEIRLEEQEGDPGKLLRCRIDAARTTRTGARLEVQVVGGKDRWVVKGSRLEGFPADAKPGRLDLSEVVNVEVTQKAGGLLHVEADSKAWGDLRPGLEVLLRPATNATLYRNLLKAFLAARRLGAGPEVEHPMRLPPAPKPAKDADIAGLTPAQGDAVARAMALPDGGVLLVHGPPGTGKTTVIARLVREWSRRGRSVLVASHTHVAIDNALRKALRDGPGVAKSMVRLGDSGRVAADLGEHSRRVGDYRDDLGQAESEGRQAEPLFARLQARHRVVGMTLDALACALLQSTAAGEPIDPFDLVIVDEAGMNGYPKLAIAGAVARRLVLVGDPLQLPPIVRAWSFRNDENHRRSHFEAVQMMRPELAVLLDQQFRCDPALYSWSEKAVYGGEVASWTAPKALRPKILGHRPGSPVVWLDTSGIPGNASEQAGRSRTNPTHLDLALRVAKDIARAGVDARDIGYITPFRAQSELWQETVEGSARHAALRPMTASTVDAFQGSERRAIVFDLTTLHPAKPHEDHRRLNVSLTRAEEFLVILGPRPFVRKPEENPFLWSLQNWGAAETVRPPLAVAQS